MRLSYPDSGNLLSSQPHTSLCSGVARRGLAFLLAAFFVTAPDYVLGQAATSTATPSNPVYPQAGSAASVPAAMPGNTSATLPSTPSTEAPPVISPPPAPYLAGPSSGITLPAPPSPSAFSSNPSQIEREAEEVARQAAMKAQAKAEFEAEERQREQEHNLKSFDRASSGLLPLSPDQIRAFMRRLEATQEAAVPPSEGPPKGQVRFKTLSLEPGVEPPEIDLASGYVTTITLVDATGEPWPILDVGVGGNFEVSPTPAGSHVVRVMPLTRVGHGDLSILLKDLPTPVIFKLASGGPNVDLRYDARIPKYSAKAKVPLINRPRLEAGSETIMSVLANAPPKDAKRLKVRGLDARTMAWAFDNRVYVRTPLTLLSPAWDASVSSADGMTVYEIGDAPILLMSENGAIVRAHIVRDEDHDRQQQH